MLGRSETSAASSFWRRAETVKARVEGATLREARRSERVADCRRAIVRVCVLSLHKKWPGLVSVAGRDDMMVIIVPAQLGQSEAGGVRAGHSLLLSQASQSRAVAVALSRGRAVTLQHSHSISSLIHCELACPFLSVCESACIFDSASARLLHLRPLPPSPLPLSPTATPCRGLSKISSSMTMRKRHVLSV